MLSLMQRVLIASLLIAACGSSHMTDEGPAPDGGPPVDMALPSVDGGDLDADLRTPTSCTVETGERLGEGCFCNGPLAYRDGFLYRQSIGIEVYTADGGDLNLVRTVEERASAQGGLAIAGDHLVSLLDFSEDENLVVYSLGDPASPRRVGGFRLPHDAVIDLAAGGDQLLVASRSVDDASLTWLDLSDPVTPVERWTMPTTGTPLSVALSDHGAFVVEDRGEPGETEQWLVWLNPDGSLNQQQRLVGRRWRRAVTVVGSALFVSGPAERTIERFGLGFELVPAGALDTGDEDHVGGDLLVRGDLAMLSNPVLIADVRAPMRELALAESPIGDMHHIAAPDGPLEWVYGSGGNGVIAARISCE